MNDEAQHEQPRSSKDLIWVLLCWFAVMVLLYILSVGPVMMICVKMKISAPQPAGRLLVSFYKPVEWAYTKTILHKPSGIYWHLWVPSHIDGKGDTIRK
jgi:hypothetical protein